MTLSLVWQLCFTLLSSAHSPSQFQQTRYNFLGDAGCVVLVLYILSRHYSVLWNRALPAVTDFFIENWIWPGPLRRRKTRKLVFKGCRDMICVIFGLAALLLLLTNAAAPPSPVADKWFAATPKSHWETAADKQAGSTPLVQQPSSPHLQLGTHMALNTDDAPKACPKVSFADSCIPWLRNVSKQSVQQSQPNAAAIKDATIKASTLQDKASGPSVTRPTASAHTTAMMPALSRSLMLVPGLPICRTIYPPYVLAVEAQHTLVVQPFLPMFKSLGQASAHREDLSSMTTPAAADIAVAPSLPDLACNDTWMCCMVDSLTQPQLTTTTVHPPRTFAALSDPPTHVAASSPYTHLLPNLRSWSWLQILLIAVSMLSLGFIIPGMCFPKYRVLNQCEGSCCLLN